MKEAIEKLFTATSTPKSLTPEAAKLIESLFPSLIAVHPDKMATRAVATFCVNLLNSKNLKGLSKAQPVLKTIIQPILDELPSEEASEIFRIIDALSVNLEKHDLARLFKQKPREPDNPLLFFHLIARKFPAYPALALTCHRLLRHAEEALKANVKRGDMPGQKARKKLEGVVTPFIHLVHFYKVDDADTAFISDLAPRKVVEAIELGQHDDSVRYIDDKTTEAYIRIVMSIIDGSFPLLRNRRRIIYEWGTQLIIGKRFIQEKVYEEGLSYKEWITLDGNAEVESEEGGYPLEEGEIEENESSNDDIARRMLFSQIRPSQFPCFYQRQAISLNDYSRIFHGLFVKDLDDMNNEELAAAMVFLCLIFFGFNPKKIANMKIYGLADISITEDLNPGELFHDVDREVIYYRMYEDQVANIFKSSSQAGASMYRSSGTIVELPVHRILNKVMKSFTERASRKAPLTLPKFRNIINSHRAPYISAISPFSFPGSFFSYAVSRYNMDPLIAAYISCRTPREQRAQTFYTSVPAERIRADAIHFQECLTGDILANCERLGLSVTKDVSQQDTATPSHEPVARFVGSGFVPDMDGLKGAISKIKTLLLPGAIKDPKRHLNLYTFYNMLLLRLTTGLRQIEVERMRDKDVDIEGRLLSVQGKGNRLYDEHRLIPLIPIALQSLEELKKAQKDYYWWVIGRGELAPIEIEQPACQNLFYLVNERGLPIPASSSNIREFLRTENWQLFPYKLNAPRHLLRTFLFEKKVPYQSLNAFIGHQTKGKEFLSHYSLAQIADMRKEIMPHIDEVVRELDLTLIPYKSKR